MKWPAALLKASRRAQARTTLQHQLQPQLEPDAEPVSCAHAARSQRAWLSAAVNSRDCALATASRREDLPSAVLQQLQYRAQRNGKQAAGCVQQRKQKPPPDDRSAAELDIGACMAALDQQSPTRTPANDAARRQGSAAARDAGAAEVIARQPTVQTPAAQDGDGPADAPSITGVFARREKRKAEAEIKRRARKAAEPDGAADLSFFMQLRKPVGGGAAAPAEPEPTVSDNEDSADSSAGATPEADSGSHGLPKVRLFGRSTSRHLLRSRAKDTRSQYISQMHVVAGRCTKLHKGRNEAVNAALRTCHTISQLAVIKSGHAAAGNTARGAARRHACHRHELAAAGSRTYPGNV